MLESCRLEFSRNRIKMKKKELTIRESIHGNFFYHIAENGVPLCGNDHTMITRISLSCWGMKTHLHERYCPECDKIFKDNFNERECSKNRR